MERIARGGVTFALLLRNEEFKGAGTHFFTPEECSIQLGMIKQAGPYVQERHVHAPRTKSVENTYEAVYVREGKISMDFFADLQAAEPFQSVDMRAGDLILLMDGPHRYRSDGGFEVILIKQGPFGSTARDKVVASR